MKRAEEFVLEESKRSPFNTRMKKMGFNPKLVNRLKENTRQKELLRRNRSVERT